MNTLITLRQFNQFVSNNKDLTFCELIYSIFRNSNSGLELNDCFFKIRELSNNELFTLIERAEKSEEGND